MCVTFSTMMYHRKLLQYLCYIWHFILTVRVSLCTSVVSVHTCIFVTIFRLDTVGGNFFLCQLFLLASFPNCLNFMPGFYFSPFLDWLSTPFSDKLLTTCCTRAYITYASLQPVTTLCLMHFNSGLCYFLCKGRQGLLCWFLFLWHFLMLKFDSTCFLVLGGLDYLFLFHTRAISPSNCAIA